jgi:hypothetical protein
MGPLVQVLGMNEIESLTARSFPGFCSTLTIHDGVMGHTRTASQATSPCQWQVPVGSSRGALPRTLPVALAPFPCAITKPHAPRPAMIRKQCRLQVGRHLFWLPYMHS